MEEVITELQEIRRAYTAQERALILHNCLINLAEESEDRSISTEDILTFLKAARI